MVEKISQHVDTLKFHYYMNKDISDESFLKYLDIVNSLISLKSDSNELSNSNLDTKRINKNFGTHKFNVMAKGIQGFSVVIASNDISIAMRKAKTKVNSSPIIKVEFRAEFLARKGYKKAIQLVNTFISDFIIDEANIKVSEIHLAADIQGYDFSPLDFYRIKTRARKRTTYELETEYSKASTYGGLTTFTGMTFGGGDYHFRVYNKTVEINTKKNKAFSKTLLWEGKNNYNSSLTVWRLEIQIRRAKLKKLVNSDLNTLDNYDNVLNAIPDLWNRALTDYTFKSIHRDIVSQMMDGVRVLKSGKEKPFTKNAIYQVFKRSEDLYFWEELKLWNGYQGLDISSAFKTPSSGSFDYVSNSIKSLYSTIGKHFGDVNIDTLVESFKRSNELSISNKGVSLLEDSFDKQLDWFERIEFLSSNGCVNLPLYKKLESNIYSTVFDVDKLMKSSSYSSDIEDRLLKRLKIKLVS